MYLNIFISVKPIRVPSLSVLISQFYIKKSMSETNIIKRNQLGTKFGIELTASKLKYINTSFHDLLALIAFARSDIIKFIGILLSVVLLGRDAMTKKFF